MLWIQIENTHLIRSCSWHWTVLFCCSSFCGLLFVWKKTKKTRRNFTKWVKANLNSWRSMVGHSYSTNADFRVSVRTFTATLFATVCFAVCVLLLVCSYKKSSGNMTKTARSEIYIQQLEQTFFIFHCLDCTVSIFLYLPCFFRSISILFNVLYIWQRLQ